MKKILSLLLFTLILISNLIGQNQANNWYFGIKAGLTFNTNPPTALLNGQLSTGEGSATISDHAGNLLFYTDGITVYNRNHLIMPNGIGLMGNPSAAQSAIIVPKPGSNTNFYIITVPVSGTVGMRYSEVDITLDGGMGDLLISNKNTFMFSSSSEKVTVVSHANGFYYWVIGRFQDAGNSKKYISFLVDCNGIDISNAVISDVGITNAENWGYLIASPDGSKLASASSSSGIEMADFDNSTGLVSNTIFLGSLYYSAIQGGNYGVSFSPNSQVLYGSSINNWALVQWDLNAPSIPASETLINYMNGGSATRPSYNGGALQLGPDGKMYVAHTGLPFLGVVNNPNIVGLGCNFQNNAVDLQGRSCVLGLPPFIQSYFDTTSLILASDGCVGNPIQFSLSNNSYTDSVRWNFDDPTSAVNTNLTLSPTHIYNNPGTYNVRLLRFFNCITDTVFETVVVHNLDSTQQTHSLCQNDNFILPDGIVVNSPGTYFSTIPSILTGCDSVITTTLVSPPTSVAAGNDLIVCNGTSAQLQASQAVNYIWTPSIGLNNPSISNPIATPTTTTTYTVTGTDTLGCITSDQMTVNVNPLPAINAGIDQTICLNDPVTLSGSGGATYVWDNAVIDGTAFSPTVTTTYTVTGTDANGCVNTDQILVTVNPLPVIDAGTDQTICINDAATLSGAGGATYIWDNAVIDATAFNPTVTNTYTVTGTDANGCVNTDQVVVNVNPLPLVDAGMDQTICLNDAVTLSGSGAVTYVWDNGVTDGIAFNPTSTSTYKVTGTDANGCVNTDLVTVTVNPLPPVNAGVDQAICINDAATLSASGAVTYVWDNGVTDGIAFNPTVTTTYIVTGTDAAGCVNTDQVVIVVNPLPVITFDVSAMQGCLPMNITYTSTGNYVNCDWLFGDGTAASGCGNVVNTYTNPGCYSVTLTATSPDGCVNQATSNNIICIPPNPIADFTTSAGYQPLNMIHSSIDFFNSSAHASSYLWNFGTGTTSTATSPSHTYPNYDAGEYPMYLVAYNSLGCTDTAFAEIIVEESLIYYVPNVFTPNGDQYNSTFKPVFTAGYDPADFNMYIFDRWGELIFESHDAKMGWDGTYVNSGIIQDGIYTWKIDFKLRNSDKRKAEIGHVTLMR